MAGWVDVHCQPGVLRLTDSLWCIDILPQQRAQQYAAGPGHVLTQSMLSLSTNCFGTCSGRTCYSIACAFDRALSGALGGRSALPCLTACWLQNARFA